MNYKPGTKIEKTGIYWCTVCKTPVRFAEGQQFPTCKNMCGRGHWHLVEVQPQPNAQTQ